MMMEFQHDIVELFSLPNSIENDENESGDNSEECQQSTTVSLTHQLHESSSLSGPDLLLEDETFSNSLPQEGIEATDIGSLFEQFLEYEQGSDDADLSSYPDSSMVTPVECMTPVESGNVSDDSVLGRLMIVQEKLSQEVASSSNGVKGEHNNNLSKIDGLIRTVNGIHPKGDNIRMADSPKFAKFKKKRTKHNPPLRRCVSGSTTPRCTSPSYLVSPEEMKKREAKLIQALALTFPKQNQQCLKSVTVVKEKLNISKPLNGKKTTEIANEPLLSRLMPVVSKRNKNNTLKTTTSDPRLAQSKGTLCLDPRLNKVDYGESSNITHLKNTKLVEIDSSVNTGENETVDDRSIIDMTIDHDTLAGSIISVANVLKTKIPQGENMIVEVENEFQVSTKSDQNTDCNPDTKNVVLQQADAVDVNVKARDGCIKPPRNYRRVNNFSNELSDNESKEKFCKRKRTRSTSRSTGSSSRKRSLSPNRTSLRSSSITKSPEYCSKRSRSSTSHSPNRTGSRYSSQEGSRGSRSSSLSRYSSRSPSRDSSSSCSPQDRSSRKYSSGDDAGDNDINSKLSELSNPVPYDIEHERKVRFLTGNASRGNAERRNIYAGGIDRRTTRTDLADRFQRFGRIEKISLHFRDRGDNYAFIVFDDPEHAMRAIEEGNDDPSYPQLELCFGGRRKFVGGSYVDFDGNNEYLAEKEIQSRCESPEDDFDRLLKMAMSDSKKRDKTPEWT